MRKGFTLIEIMTAASIFLFIMTISLGSVLAIYDSDRVARNQRIALNTINVVLERMTREMRYGYSYHCGESGTPSQPQDCATLSAPGNAIYFYDSNGTQNYYATTTQNPTRIINAIGNGLPLPITPTNVVIDYIYFNVSGSSLSPDTLQSKVLIRIAGRSGAGEEATSFKAQTLVSQRRRDL